MFKAELDGLYHREQFRDYLREQKHDYATLKLKHDRRKVVIGFGVVTGLITLLMTLATSGVIAALLH
jgi:hypothetical protein